MIILLLLLFLLCVLPAEASNRHIIRISSHYSSVTINEDSTLSFRYCGAAKRVSVQSDLLYADEDTSRYTDHTRRIKMHLKSDGCFHATTRAVHLLFPRERKTKTRSAQYGHCVAEDA